MAFCIMKQKYSTMTFLFPHGVVMSPPPIFAYVIRGCLLVSTVWKIGMNWITRSSRWAAKKTCFEKPGSFAEVRKFNPVTFDTVILHYYFLLCMIFEDN